jgi:hypothetical protein
MESLVTEPDPDEDSTPPEEVTVHTQHYVEPVPTGAFSAVPWALLHPLEAWRIIAPISSD